MKRRDIIKEIRAHAKDNGLAYREVEGANHTVVSAGGRRTVVARHREINDLTVKAIRKQLGIGQEGE
ncbi:hypothetical protein [Mycobacterium talmoniae]|uniref:hypothetical protein n=1 Tax=Mycobacterium talmoniae TaxID=1858794 RepID=UPI0009F4A943|nr:hypothetical protein [Mycobacterium talmoniae]